MEISTLQLQLDQAEQDRHQLQQVWPSLCVKMYYMALGVYFDPAERILQQLQQVAHFALPLLIVVVRKPAQIWLCFPQSTAAGGQRWACAHVSGLWHKVMPLSLQLTDCPVHSHH